MLLLVHHLISGCLVAVAAILLARASSARAATVIWGPATTISGDSDVSTSGTLLGALNVGENGANPTVNGVTFTGLTLTGATVTSGPFTFHYSGGFLSASGQTSANLPFASLSASYQSLLSSYSGTTGEPFSLDLTGLTLGRTYQFEWWVNDTNNPLDFVVATAGRYVPFNPNTLRSVALSSNTLDSWYGGVGQFDIGTFTADAATQAVTFSAPVTIYDPFLDAVQLRDVTPVATGGGGVPLPAGLVGGGLTLLLLAALHRRVMRPI
jgi:hypothetical protein